MLGLAGFILGIIGTGLALVPLSGAVANINPEIDPVGAAPIVLRISLGMLILGAGLVLLGITTLRAKTLLLWRGLPLGVGLLSTISGMTYWLAYYVPLNQGRNPWNPWNFGVYVLYPAVHLLLGLGWIGLGTTLAAEAAPVAQPPPTSV